MKTFALICFLVLITPVNARAQVIVYLQGRYLNQLMNLDSIVVENTTHYDRMVLPAPPEITTYAIDLVKGAIINGITEHVGATGMYVLFNKPGHAGILLHARSGETFTMTQFDGSGRIIRRKTCKTESDRTRIDIQAQ